MTHNMKNSLTSILTRILVTTTEDTHNELFDTMQEIRFQPGLSLIKKNKLMAEALENAIKEAANVAARLWLERR